MKRMLINATQEEELRMAMVDGQRLYDLNIELPASERKKANIYKGKITRVEPSLEAAFVDFGAERHGFLPLKEISSEYFVKPVDGGKPNIREVLKEGQDIVVQIDKEERGNKGAALTTFVSLAGRFIVLKPNKARSGGVSRRIVGSDRDLARKSLNDIEVPDGMSVILRTAGIDRTPEELAWDLENLLTIWTAILNVVLERKSPFLIYRESNAIVRALRDYMTTDIGEILIDNETAYKEACEFVEQVMPHNLRKLKHYVDPVPLFTRFQIETQIESAFTHSVNLPSGGSIVIDHTEALVSIDINSARATKGGDIEATALNTNLEAAEEIARQLRIRDLGGLIVIDFIDMGPQKHQRDVENRLRESVRQDRARVQIGKISRFGLLEMSRQRLRPSLGESAYLTCPRCSGIGTIRSVESLALAILRIIGEEARKERTAKVIAQLPVEVATYLLNEKRDWVQSLESNNDMQVVLVANSALETPHYDVRRVRDDQTELPENAGASYELAEPDAEPESAQDILARKAVEPAAIAVLKPSSPAPKREKAKAGFWASVTSLFSSDEEEQQPQKKSQQRRRSSSSKDSRGRGGQKSRRRADSRRSDDKRTDGRRQKKKTGSKKKASGRDGKAQPKDTANRGKKPQQPKQADKEQRDEARADGQKPARKRRSRGGRRRRRSADRPAQDGNSGTQQQAEQMPKESARADAKPEQKGDAGPQRKTAQKKKPPAEPKDNTEQKTRSEQPSKPQAELQSDTEQKPRPDEKRQAQTERKPVTSNVGEDGPPRVRTDAERAADAAASGRKSPAAEPAARRSSSPAEAKPAPRAEPRPQPSAKPDAAQEQRPEPQPVADAKPPQKPKPEPKPAGRLLPWDEPAPKPAEPPKPPASAESPPQD